MLTSPRLAELQEFGSPRSPGERERLAQQRREQEAAAVAAERKKAELEKAERAREASVKETISDNAGGQAVESEPEILSPTSAMREASGGEETKSDDGEHSADQSLTEKREDEEEEAEVIPDPFAAAEKEEENQIQWSISEDKKGDQVEKKRYISAGSYFLSYGYLLLLLDFSVLRFICVFFFCYHNAVAHRPPRNHRRADRALF